MRIYPLGVLVFAAFCVLLAVALSNPAWMQIASAVVTVLMAIGVATILFPLKWRSGATRR